MSNEINKKYVVLLSVIVALGGFLLGFDSAVIAGAVPYYSKVFGLNQSSFWFGFSVSSLTAGSIVGNFIGGILADKFGRRIILKGTALLFTFCAITTALANNLTIFITGRLIGGLGVGMAILVAPMYIAEVAPQKYRGTLVSINQLNIVLGISIAFFTNYFINRIVTDPDVNWRWMLGIGVIPAMVYFFLLFFVPQSPRWLVQKSREDEAAKVLSRISGDNYAKETIAEINQNLEKTRNVKRTYFRELFSKEMRTIMIIGLGIAFLQQISAINAILYYAPIIFEAAGKGRDVAFMQASILGIVNVLFTLLAMYLIDKIGRKPLLIIGLSGIITAYALSSISFYKAEYVISNTSIENIADNLKENGYNTTEIDYVTHGLLNISGKIYKGELNFFSEVKKNTGNYFSEIKNTVLKNSIQMNAWLLLFGILLFIASFAISLGPVTWALLSEIFPNNIRGLAISVAGTFNALVSAGVVTIFPVELDRFGSGLTFAIFAVICFLGLLFVLKYIPETKGKSLEEIELQLKK